MPQATDACRSMLQWSGFRTKHVHSLKGLTPARPLHSPLHSHERPTALLPSHSGLIYCGKPIVKASIFRPPPPQMTHLPSWLGMIDCGTPSHTPIFRRGPLNTSWLSLSYSGRNCSTAQHGTAQHYTASDNREQPSVHTTVLMQRSNNLKQRCITPPLPGTPHSVIHIW
jgi:hypothetical protein